MARKGTGGPMDEGPANRRFWWTILRGVLLAVGVGWLLWMAAHNGK